MAHLLGNKFCLESLQKDVGDLQSVVIDIFSRTGAITAPSWKYPEKLSCDVDINELLDRYAYSDDEEDCQVSHVILLELVIDRLILVIQSFSSYVEQMLAMGRNSSTTSNLGNSIGLIIKRYWNKLIQLHSIVKQIKSDSRNATAQISTLQFQDEVNDVSSMNGSEKESLVEAVPMMMKKKEDSISTDYNCRATQTYETAFIPCESCDGAQFCLKEAGKMISEMCDSQGMKSNVRKVWEKYQDSWMSVQDMRTWISMQNKDLQLLSDHLVTLSNKLRDTEERLQNSQAQNTKLRAEQQALKKDLKLQKEDLSVTRKQYEKKLQESRDKNDQGVREFERRREDFAKVEESLKVQLADLKCQLEQKSLMITGLEDSKREVLADLAKNKTDQKDLKKSQKYVEILEKELKEIHTKLEESSRSLACLEVKNQSTNKQFDSMKAKQTQLFEQIEKLELENEELKQELAELETEKDELSEKLESNTDDLSNHSNEKSELMRKIELLTSEKNQLANRVKTLEDSTMNLELQVEKAKEQERLLIAYPDLNGPIDIDETGDVAQDMENQIRANTVRINILMKENESLKNSVRKIMTTVTRTVSRASKEEPPRTQPPTSNPMNVPKLQLWR